MQEFSGVQYSWVHSEIESRVDFICREEERMAAWGHAGGPGNRWSHSLNLKISL
jgi:hypothetical protein